MEADSSQDTLFGAAQRVERWVSRITMRMAIAAGAIFLPLAFYMAFDAASRRLGGPFTGVSDEIAGQVLAFGGTWAMAYALARGAHVRIDVLMPVYPARVRELLHLVAFATATLLAVVLAINAWHLSYESYLLDARAYSMLGQPLVYAQSATAVGFTMLTVQAAVMVVAGGVRFARGAAVLPPTDPLRPEGDR